MIRSMTGFGKAESANAAVGVSVELRTVNHRYFDFTSRLPDYMEGYEDRLLGVVRQRLRRGRCNLTVSIVEKRPCLERVVLNKDIARAYHRLFLQVKDEFALGGNLEARDLFLLPKVIGYERMTPELDEIWRLAEEAAKAALDALDSARRKEGKVLYRDIVGHLKRIRSLIETARRHIPACLVRHKNSLMRRIGELASGASLERGRLEIECALFARNCDINEELVRIEGHLNNFEGLLSSDKEVGKELDFVSQELNREANTIGSKAGDYRISSIAIKIKSEIEKIREQVQNVE